MTMPALETFHKNQGNYGRGNEAAAQSRIAPGFVSSAGLFV